MIVADTFREIADNLRRNRTRTILTGLAVVWGIFMLVVLLGVMRGMINSANENLSRSDDRVITIYGGTTTKPFRGYTPGRVISLDERDRRRLADDGGSRVEKVVGRSYNNNFIVSTPQGSVSGVTGVYPEQTGITPVEIVEGRFINDMDISECRKSIVIHKSTAKKLFPDSVSAVGRLVESAGLSWRVVGIYKQGWMRDNFIPLTTLDALTTDKSSFRQLDVIATSFDDVDDSRQMVDEIKRSLASNHNFDPFDQGALWAYNNYANRIESQQAMKILETAMWIVGILTMLTGIVGISNIMFVAVKERTHEIGIRRAIGAKPRRILADIVAESVVLTLMFGYIGIVVGMAATEAVKLVPHADEMLLNPGIDLAMALEVTAVLVVAGIVAGLFPAVKATKVKPVEALRDE